MAIDFPNSPTTGDTYTAGGRTWQWDGTVWAAYGNYPDPTVLKIDTGTNRVGINNTSPTTALDVTGDLTVSGKVNATAPTSTKTASYTLAAGDEGTRIVMNNAGATTITVDDAVFAAGDTVWIHNIGAGTTTVTAGTATVDTAGSLDVGQWEGGSLYFTSASSAIFFRGGGAGVAYGTATGGTSSTITVDGESYTLLTFTSSGTLTVTDAGLFDYLIVGGGGGSGTSNGAGGGGAGGYATGTIYLDSNEAVIVAAGSGANSRGAAGSGFSTNVRISASGGGTGGSISDSSGLFGNGGASGGGSLNGATRLGGIGDGITGNNGGNGSGSDASGAGGGGAGAAGGTAPNHNTGGDGGDGSDASAFRGEAATTTYYAGGGAGGGNTTGGDGGLGGGGDGGNFGSGSTAGAANTGGGGGGPGKAGGSGIVLVRFKN